MSKENEKKVNEEVEVKGEVAAAAEVEEEVITEEELNVFVERKPVIADTGRKYYNYYVKGEMQGREIRADVIPSDKGGYEQLDMLFSGKEKLPLVVGRSSQLDATNKIIRRNTYAVKFVDDCGLDFTVSIKGREGSDRSYLEYIVKVARYKVSHANDKQE